MKNLALSILFFSLASPMWANTYYLATAAGGGSDSNNGISTGTPWVSPSHAVNCGDVIIAAASSSYSSTNFTTGKWGTVTCPAGNNVAWLKCVTFDACKISASGSQGMYVDNSYWGIQGWEVTVTTYAYGTCFNIQPNYTTPVQIHHIIFANDVANGCQGGGFVASPKGGDEAVSFDYVAFVGNIAYNTAQNGSTCSSGFSMSQPIASDNLPGTHLYMAGNFSWANLNPNPCNGGPPTDGEGAIFDTLDTTLGLSTPYAMQVVANNNLLIGNGGRGLQVEHNNAGTSPFANVYLRNNTMWGNNEDANQINPGCAELFLQNVNNVQAFYNLAATNAADGCGGIPIYAYYVGDSPTSTDSVHNSWGYAASGTNNAENGSAGFSYGPNNTFGTNPGFANATVPGAPSCGSASSVPNCMAPVIANFTATTPAAAGYGYQIPSKTQTYDPLFPQWLCNVNLPPGLVTVGCLALSSLAASPTITGVKTQ